VLNPRFVYHSESQTVQQQASDVELRLAELQTQIDKLSHDLQQWHESPEHAHFVEDRLSQLLERCSETLNRVTAIDEHHSKVVEKLEARLSDWSFVESRLEKDSDQRIRQFEQIIEHEWEALKKLHEEPAKQLREQAANLGETCVAAANLALRGFERSEARFVALEADLQERMVQLSREVQAAVAELRGATAPRSLPAGDVSPFPLESVMRIHDELRRFDEVGALPPPPPATGEAPAILPASAQSALPPASHPDGSQLPDRAGTERHLETASPFAGAGLSNAWRAGIVAAAILLLVGGFLVFRLQRQVNEASARVTAAERQAESATQLANQRIEETQQDAERKLTAARETAQQAQIVSSVLAAPDLFRLNLGGTTAAPRAFAQVLWSRSRGLVFSASRLPALAQNTRYQLWLLTADGAVNAGLFTVDAEGRGTLATEKPPNVPRPVINAAVTVEPSGGRPIPTGTTVLRRVQ
jgi:Anti-sigma-K factor rskA